MWYDDILITPDTDQRYKKILYNPSQFLDTINDIPTVLKTVISVLTKQSTNMYRYSIIPQKQVSARSLWDESMYTIRL